ncbi:MAG: hypothetical protein ACK4NR_09915 [Micavibrio sp.]
MPRSLYMTRDFTKAAAYHNKQMRAVAQSVQLLFSAPGFYKGEWGRKDGNNCYNFALHISTHDFLQPGFLSDLAAYGPPATPEYLHEGALADGLIYMGKSFLKCPGDHFPVALFLEDEASDDYHWFALRQKVENNEPTGRYIWCHKNGDRPPEVIRDQDTIFSVAQKEQYPVFAGYYAVPYELTYYRAGRRYTSNSIYA